MTDNPLCRLGAAGQSVWLDFITRDLVRSGRLAELVENDCVSGMTVNPTIFEQAVDGSDAYDEEIGRLARDNTSTVEVYHRLMTADVREALRLLRPVYDRTQARDGYVSMEVAPEYAHAADPTIKEARELAGEAGGEPNLMIKVPGTVEGHEAIRRLTADGFNINVTLLFSADQYLPVAEAYMAGLEERAARGLPVANIVSVASLFVSRIDTMVDQKLDRLANEGDADQAEKAGRLRGAAGTATAELTYRAYRDLLAGDRWKALAAKGARAQRVLWASTGAKDPAFADVKYVEELISPDTINTMPLKTLEAFRDHGRVEAALDLSVDKAGPRLAELGSLIDMHDVYRRLQAEGIEKFGESYKHLFAVLETKCRMSAA